MLKVLFGGSPACAAKALELILKDSAMSNSVPEEEYKIVGVLTNPPSAQGRHKELIPTEVEQYAIIWNRARNDNLAVFTPEHIKQPEREQIASLEPDIFVCFAYGPRIHGIKNHAELEKIVIRSLKQAALYDEIADRRDTSA